VETKHSNTQVAIHILRRKHLRWWAVIKWWQIIMSSLGNHYSPFPTYDWIQNISLSIQDSSSTRLWAQGMKYSHRCFTQSLKSSNLTRILHYFSWNEASWCHFCAAISYTPPSRGNRSCSHATQYNLLKSVRTQCCVSSASSHTSASASLLPRLL
jgi:hypothetical protein